MPDDQTDSPAPSRSSEAEDRLIRGLLIGAATSAVALFLAFALIVTVMVSYNFNILEWME